MKPPKFILIRVSDFDFKVSSDTLSESSRYFDALFRFHYLSPMSHGGTAEIDRNSPLPPELSLSFDSPLFELKAELSQLESLCFVLYGLGAESESRHQNGEEDRLLVQCKTALGSDALASADVGYSLDFLFDCVLICSRYLFDDHERYYSDLFVHNLSQYASNYSVKDNIPPPATNRHHQLQSHQLQLHYHAEQVTRLSSYLSPLDMQKLATVFNLDYLSFRLENFISEKRSHYLRRLHRLFFS